ncbi:MAG: hypothetical protein P8127_00195 [Acidobacteriota bacterium]
MRSWLRTVVPDLFLASVVALLVTVAMVQLDETESTRIRVDAQEAAADGLTLDERIEVYQESIRRSTLLHLPLLVAAAGALIGLISRNRSWSWLTAIGAALPAIIMGIAFFIDRPIPAGAVLISYTAIASSMSLVTLTLRQRLIPAGITR